MLMKSEQSTLLLIDVQEKLMPAIAHGQEVINQCVILATIAGLLDIPVLATEQLMLAIRCGLWQMRRAPATSSTGTLPSTGSVTAAHVSSRPKW